MLVQLAWDRASSRLTLQVKKYGIKVKWITQSKLGSLVLTDLIGTYNETSHVCIAGNG